MQNVYLCQNSTPSDALQPTGYKVNLHTVTPSDPVVQPHPRSHIRDYAQLEIRTQLRRASVSNSPKSPIVDALKMQSAVPPLSYAQAFTNQPRSRLSISNLQHKHLPVHILLQRR